jgi:hypothetical protein
MKLSAIAAAGLLTLVAGSPVAAQTAWPAPVVQVSAGQPTLGPGWRLLTLPQQKPPVTQLGAELLDGRPALRIDARASYGNLALALDGPGPAQVRWSWRVDRPNPAADVKTKPGDDSPAKVCLAFDLPLERVPFFERELLRFARTRSPEPLPAATLCWVWGHAEAVGSMVPNPYTKRVRVIVLRNRANATGRWFDEQRDVAADFRAAFGDESPQVPPVTAVLVGGDADNTGAQSLAFVAGLQFEGRLPAAPATPAAGR